MSAPMYLSNGQGIFQPTLPVHHQGEHFDEKGFKTLFEMQNNHFWYRGRHRFLMHAVARYLPDRKGLCGIDLGGGCGGWLNFLFQQMPGRFDELALADSSLTALELAKTVVPKSTTLYQIDLMDLHWENRWDVAFLLDVIEHLPGDAGALVQVCNALKPGGLLFVTTPALQFFWTYNDDLAHICGVIRSVTMRDWRRKQDCDYCSFGLITTTLPTICGVIRSVTMRYWRRKQDCRLLDSRYFMFFLSPLLWLSRTLQRTSGLSEGERSKLDHEGPQSTHPASQPCSLGDVCRGNSSWPLAFVSMGHVHSRNFPEAPVTRPDAVKAASRHRLHRTHCRRLGGNVFHRLVPLSIYPCRGRSQ